MPAFPIPTFQPGASVTDAPMPKALRGPEGDLSPVAHAAAVIGARLEQQQREQAAEQRQQQAEQLRQQHELEANESQVALANTMGDATIRYQQQLDDARNSDPASMPGLAQRVREDFDTWSDSAGQSLPILAQTQWKVHSARLRAQFVTEAMGVELQGRQAKLLSDTDSGISVDEASVSQDENRFTDTLARRAAQIGALPLQPAKRDKLLADTQQRLALAAARGYVLRNPGAAAADLDRYFGVPAEGAAPAPSTPDGYAPSASDPRGIRNNNPGNLRATGDAWQGMVGSDGQYVRFATPEAGIRAMGRNLQSYGADGVNTVQGVVARWAPAGDANDVPGYVAAVSKATGFAPDQKLDLHDRGTLLKLSAAMIQHENGRQPYSDQQLATGIDASLGTAPLQLGGLPRTITPEEAARSASDAGQYGDRKLPLFLNGQFMPPQTALQLRNEAVAELHRMAAGQRAQVEARTKDFQAMVLSGVAPPPSSVPSPVEFSAAYGPDSERLYRTEVAEYQRLGGALQSMDGASWQDRQAILQRFTPQPGDGFDEHQRMQQTLIKANMLFEKRLAADPAATALAAPSVQQARSAMLAAQGDPQVTPAQRQAAMDAYANATTAEQQRLGVERIGADALGEAGKTRQPGVRLLTNGEANSIASQFHSNPAKAAELMDGLQATYGKRFPDVFAQLAGDDKIPPAALVIPNMSDSYAKERLARLSDPKLQKEILDQLPPGAKKDIDAALQMANEPFYGTLANQPGGQRTFSMIVTQQQVLAASYVAQGRSASDAAKAAFRETVGHAYTFADTMRVPNKEDPASVIQATAAIARNPELIGSVAPQAFTPNLAEKDRQAAWHDAIRTGATWVTNGDESGAVLYVRANTPGGMPSFAPVRGADGKPVSWTWSQLRAMGAQAAARDAANERARIAQGTFGDGMHSRRGDFVDQAVQRARATQAAGD